MAHPCPEFCRAHVPWFACECPMFRRAVRVPKTVGSVGVEVCKFKEMRGAVPVVAGWAVARVQWPSYSFKLQVSKSGRGGVRVSRLPIERFPLPERAEQVSSCELLRCSGKEPRYSGSCRVASG
jgi:hypothetical protein